MKSPDTVVLRLLGCVLADAGAWCKAHVARDIETVKRRVKHEGISFLTISLPTFGSDFERSLDLGYIGSNCFAGFRRSRGLPAFLRGFLSQVFDSNGCLLEAPCAECIRAVRQICYLCKKVRIECSESRKQKAIQGYLDVENQLADYGRDRVDPALYADFQLTSGIIWTGILQDVQRKLCSHEFRPRHGPGATADGLLGNQKYRLAYWHDRLEPYFPSVEYIGFNPGCFVERADELEYRDSDGERPVKVVFVPKTLKSPRVIAMEPAAQQYCQQALLPHIVNAIEDSWLVGGQVNFTDQSINQSLAKSSSIDGTLATLDLSEASDRVHQDYVYDMLHSVPYLRDAVFACRSTRAILPDSTLVELRKFASMGSALCFPFEAMVFYTILLSGILRAEGLSISPSTVASVAIEVFVYGDDIIVPTKWAMVARNSLEAFGLKVNDHKSFWNGKFRESCGSDYYDGDSVKPVYLREVAPASKRNSSEIASWISTSNQFYWVGYWKTAAFMRKHITSVAGRITYRSDAQLSGAAWETVLPYFEFDRWSKDLHRFEVKTVSFEARKRRDSLDGIPALLKWGLNVRPKSPFEHLIPQASNDDHLEVSVQRGAGYTKHRWSPSHL